jgi:superfamily II DNA or RNA helicase
MPLSFKGRLIQYAGRLHRIHADKREIRVFDYLDENHPVTMAMFRRRASAYRQMGYEILLGNSLNEASGSSQRGLFESAAEPSSILGAGGYKRWV